MADKSLRRPAELLPLMWSKRLRRNLLGLLTCWSAQSSDSDTGDFVTGAEVGQQPFEVEKFIAFDEHDEPKHPTTLVAAEAPMSP